MIYRLVGGVYLMVVARPEANVFWLLNLSSACVRLLVTLSKGVEVMPNKLARFYPEVCGCTPLDHCDCVRGQCIADKCSP